MDEINRMFEAVHTSKWLPQVEEHTFPSKLMELTLPEEEAILSTTMYKRGCGSKPEEAAAATVAGVAARLDAIIASFGAAFVKLGDCAPKDVAPPATLEDEWRGRLAATSAPCRASNAGLAAFVWARSRTLRVESGAAAVALLTASERTEDELTRRMYARMEGGEVGPLFITVRAWEDGVDPAYEVISYLHYAGSYAHVH